MDNQDRQAIELLFARLRDVERKAPPRDAAADRFIRDCISQQPAAPYFMAQTIIVQEQALQEAQRRIQELEQGRTERQGRGLFSGIFDSEPNTRRTGVVPPVSRARAATPESMSQQQGGRGGFLAGAAQTAMGVASGVLLGNFLAGMLGGHEAHAADISPEPEHDAQVDEVADDSGDSFFDYGGDEGI